MVLLTSTAKLAVRQVVSSFLGAEAAAPKLTEVCDAIEEGKQPCVVEGNGNAKFVVRVFDKPFNRADVTADIAPGLAGVSVNLARMLCSKNLYPRG